MTLRTTEKITETSRLLHLRVWGPMVFLALLCVAQHGHAGTFEPSGTVDERATHTLQVKPR